MTENIKELLPNIQEHKLFFDYDFRLIGGTALSYHLNHRLSEDLDFCFKGLLPKKAIDEFITHCEEIFGEDKVEPIPFEIGKIVNQFSFETSGEDLTDYEQNWQIRGVKVTFFDGSSQTGLWDILEQDQYTMIGNIKVTSVDSIFMTKSLTFYNRAKARDYYDLFHMMSIEKKFTIEKILEIIQHYEKAYQDEGIGLLLQQLENPSYDEKKDEKLVGLVDEPEDFMTLNTRLTALIKEFLYGSKKTSEI